MRFRTVLPGVKQRLLVALLFCILILAPVGVAAAQTIPTPVADWCHDFDFYGSRYGATVGEGYWIDGDGFLSTIGNEPEIVSFSYYHSQLVDPIAIEVYGHKYFGGAVTLPGTPTPTSEPWSVWAYLNVFGIEAEVTNPDPNNPDIGIRIEPPFAGTPSHVMEVSVQASVPFAITSIRVYGRGVDPFAASLGPGCTTIFSPTATPTNTPNVTATGVPDTPLPTDTLDPSGTPTPTPSQTPTPTNTLTPSPTPTSTPFNSTVTIDFQSIPINYVPPGYGSWNESQVLGSGNTSGMWTTLTGEFDGVSTGRRADFRIDLHDYCWEFQINTFAPSRVGASTFTNTSSYLRIYYFDQDGDFIAVTQQSQGGTGLITTWYHPHNTLGAAANGQWVRYIAIEFGSSDSTNGMYLHNISWTGVVRSVCTSTPTPTFTPSPTVPTNTYTPGPTFTPQGTNTFTPTPSRTALFGLFTPAPTNTNIPSLTPSLTRTPAPTLTFTLTRTPPIFSTLPPFSTVPPLGTFPPPPTLLPTATPLPATATRTEVPSPTPIPTSDPGDPGGDGGTIPFLQGIIDALNGVASWLNDFSDSIADWLNTASENIANALNSTSESISDLLNDLSQQFQQMFDEFSQNLTNWLNEAYTNIVNWFNEALEGVVAWWNSFIGALGNWLAGLGAWLGSLVHWLGGTLANLVTALTNELRGIQNFFDQVRRLLEDLVHIGNLLLAIIRHLIEILFEYIRQFVTSAQAIIDLWFTVPPEPVPGLPRCATQPTQHELCAFWYILTYTVFAGQLGVLIIPAIVGVLALALILLFLLRVRDLLRNIRGVTE